MRDHSRLAGSVFTWRRPHVMAARVAFNLLYRLQRRPVRDDEVVFISRRTDEPRYDYAMLAREFQSRGWRATMHLKKVTGRNLPSYAAHVLTEIRLLGRCKVAVLDRYDPVVSLIDFECDEAAAREGALMPPASTGQVGYANLDFPVKPVVLQLWHAFGAYKRFGFQCVDMPEGHPSDFMRDWRIHHNFSWVVCSGEGARPAFAEAFSVPLSRVLPLNRPEYDKLVALRRELDRERLTDGLAGSGCSREEGDATAVRDDAGLHALRSNCEFVSSHFESGNNRGEGSRLRVLMAPTLRMSDDVPHPMRDLYAVRDALEGAVDADFTWAFHPLEEGMPAPGDVSGELLECDVVVTDYSSLVYEAQLLGKMALFYVPDIDSYRVTPGLNHDPLELAPALCARDAGELVMAIDALARDAAAYPQADLDRFVGQTFNAPQQGTVAARIVDFLIERT